MRHGHAFRRHVAVEAQSDVDEDRAHDSLPLILESFEDLTAPMKMA
jgi:hypothetical protein